MIIRVDREGTPETFAAQLHEMSSSKEIKGLLILACEANVFVPEAVDHILQQVPVPLFGGIFPAVLHNREKMDRGTVVVGLKEKPDPATHKKQTNALADPKENAPK